MKKNGKRQWRGQGLNKASQGRERKKEVAPTNLQNDHYRLLIKGHKAEEKTTVRTNIFPNAVSLAQRQMCSFLSLSYFCPPGA